MFNIKLMNKLNIDRRGKACLAPTECRIVPMRVGLKPARTLFLILGIIIFMATDATAVDSFKESFDSMQDEATVDGVDSWTVSAGNPTNAVSQSGTTFKGTGKALKLSNALTPVSVYRSAPYGNLSPSWIESVVKPGLGNQASAVPLKGIAAVCFNYTGEILVSDGATWVKTGQTFNSDQWARVLLKLDFLNHLYSVYISAANVIKTPFVPDKQNLHFIDSTINSVSKIGFDGVYNATKPGDTFVDEIVVDFVDRLAIVTPSQNIQQGQPSGLIFLQIQNANSELQAAWEDLTIELKSTSETGEFSLSKDPWLPILQAIIPEGAGQVSLYYKDGTQGKPLLTFKEYPDRGWKEAIQQVNIVGSNQSFEVFVTTPQVAGRAFMAQVVAKDVSGDVNKLFGGSVDVMVNYVSPAFGAKFITPDNAGGFINGLVNLTLTYPDCGAVEIVVKQHDDNTRSGKSGPVVFVPDRFTVTADESQVVSKPFSMTVDALNASGESTPNYQGPVIVQTVGVNPPGTIGGAMSPSRLAAGQFTNGAAQVSAAYNLWGTVNIQVYDEFAPDQKGASGNIYFAPNLITAKVNLPASGRDFFYTGEPFELRLSVLDAQDAPILNFQGALSMESKPALDDLPPNYTFLEKDKGEKSFQLATLNPGNYLFTVNSSDGLKAQSDPVWVKQASIQVISTMAPVGKTEVEIQLLDDKGKRIVSDNTLTLTITFQDPNNNESVFLDSPGKPILFHKGVAKVVIGDTEAETITINPQSSFGFKIESGTVAFGKVGKGGIGTLLYWEDKDEIEGTKGNKKE